MPGPETAESGVTPIAAGAENWLGWTVGVFRVGIFRVARSRRGACLVRFGGMVSGAVTVTGGSRPGSAAGMFCAFAGDPNTIRDAAAKDVRQTALRTLMPRMIAATIGMRPHRYDLTR